IGDAFEVVSSLAHPGGNVTGLSAFVTELEAKRLELLTETIPGLTRVAHLANMSNPLSALQRAEIARAAPIVKVLPKFIDVRTANDLAPPFEAASRERVGAVLVAIDGLTQVACSDRTRPMLHKRQKVLAKAAPSTHDRCC